MSLPSRGMQRFVVVRQARIKPLENFIYGPGSGGLVTSQSIKLFSHKHGRLSQWIGLECLQKQSI